MWCGRRRRNNRERGLGLFEETILTRPPPDIWSTILLKYKYYIEHATVRLSLFLLIVSSIFFPTTPFKENSTRVFCMLSIYPHALSQHPFARPDPFDSIRPSASFLLFSFHNWLVPFIHHKRQCQQQQQQLPQRSLRRGGGRGWSVCKMTITSGYLSAQSPYLYSAAATGVSILIIREVKIIWKWNCSSCLIATDWKFRLWLAR